MDPPAEVERGPALPAPRGERRGPQLVGRRRPSGEPPPLPRRASASTRAYLLLGVLAGALWLGLLWRPGVRVVTAGDDAVLELLQRLRWGPLTTAMRHLQALGSAWAPRAVVWPTLLLLVGFRRFQRLFALLAILLVATALDTVVAVSIGRMRPTGVAILGTWSGYAHPAAPVAGLGIALVGALYTLAPVGSVRNRAAWLVAVPLGLLVAARLYLAVDHPTDVFAALVTGVALPIAAFRLLTPDEAFPVSYRGGRRAHLDVGGRRGRAIAVAVERQLGLHVIAVEPFALTTSAGSTPLRLSVTAGEGGAPREVFGKLYALAHLRSDRWYKLARTVRYGRLEDEQPFNAVRRLVEYEDHMLRMMRDAGLPTPQPYGFVEITPEREYVIVTEFLEGACGLGDVVVDDALVDDALATVRRMWDAGLAHRDIKPGNLLVRDGRIQLIDLAFAAARPTPWRQAVDLADMMLTLALHSTPERVYARALRQFSTEEVSEAFAACRSITIPSQLRALLHDDGRDLIARFRALAPPRAPVAIQRWSVQRIALTLSVLAGAALAGALLVVNLRLARLL